MGFIRAPLASQKGVGGVLGEGEVKQGVVFGGFFFLEYCSVSTTPPTQHFPSPHIGPPPSSSTAAPEKCMSVLTLSSKRKKTNKTKYWKAGVPVDKGDKKKKKI